MLVGTYIINLCLSRLGTYIINLCLSHLCVGGDVAEAFTKAFVFVKVLEIRAQMEECFSCTCTLSGPVCELLTSNTNVSTCSDVKGENTPLCMWK